MQGSCFECDGGTIAGEVEVAVSVIAWGKSTIMLDVSVFKQPPWVIVECFRLDMLWQLVKRQGISIEIWMAI